MFAVGISISNLEAITSYLRSVCEAFSRNLVKPCFGESFQFISSVVAGIVKTWSEDRMCVQTATSDDVNTKVNGDSPETDTRRLVPRFLPIQTVSCKIVPKWLCPCHGA